LFGADFGQNEAVLFHCQISKIPLNSLDNFNKFLCERQNNSLKNVIFWDVALCGSCVKRRFGGGYRQHLQGRKIRERGTSVSRCLLTTAAVTD
jgi:hypothetical protein